MLQQILGMAAATVQYKATVQHAATHTLQHPQWRLQLRNIKQLCSKLQHIFCGIHSNGIHYTT